MRFTLIHGSWHGGWCWQDFTQMLMGKNSTVATPDLPAHGNDDTPISQISLSSYVRAVREELFTCLGQSIVVGRSMAGVVITQVAEDCPDKIAALGYLSGMLPRNGQCVFDLARSDTGARVAQKLTYSQDRMSITVRPEAVIDCFYQLCPNEKAHTASKLLRPEPVLPLEEGVRTSSSRFGSVRKYYIECLRDHAVSPILQRRMYTALPCDKVFTIDTDHSPFFSLTARVTDLFEDYREGL